MCGRYKIGSTGEKSRFFEFIEEINLDFVDEKAIKLSKKSDVNPGIMAPIILTKRSILIGTQMRWGFETGGKLVINARSESIFEKPMFISSAAAMRCAVPALGYYEWNERRERFLFSPPEGGLIMLAGLYRYAPDGTPEFVIITRRAYGEYGKIHGRMPLVLNDWRAWLRDPSAARRILAADGEVRLDIQCQSPRQLSMF